ncbi:hypothetical protein DSM106972_046290 [Dulcicalothrix desertica PCC 7102]|uniref:Anaphase-promoting complex subunit 4 WD40 domain-containing protein n=1 Tax=Dulcicalothrix desertica PCC 7102 TaxID=232991 RepID=A0A3S1CM88_9CYAN|nr:hypothetical protein [Dulcicalothrix desertica]RUT04401.1 hypothetical protein DSM106972_046290 [Dulcicalothrix desertica PCC 7102]TWH51256.1 FOG: WD40 repeat [Dulcicalothrix desertica PCC 7102]
MWDVATKKETSTLTGHTDWVNSVVFSPDGKTLASASWDKTIKLWKGATGKLIFTITGHTEQGTWVVYSLDGKTLASASDDRSIRLWNLDLDNLLAQGCHWLDGHLATRPNEEKKLCVNPVR